MADFLGLMKQATELKSKMVAMQAELDQIEVEGTSGPHRRRACRRAPQGRNPVAGKDEKRRRRPAAAAWNEVVLSAV